jgi:ectoine hydroxylase-related dioxygenase (phytanoyl-CoA dioxygenase family)
MYTIQDSDIATFERDGVICLRNVLTDAEISDLTTAIDDALRTIGTTSTGYDVTTVADAIWRDGAAAIDASDARQYDLDALAAFVRSNDARPVRDSDERSGGHFLLDTGVWMRSEAMRRVALSAVLPSVAGPLLSAEHVRFYDDQIFVKEPGTVERTAFHQDLGYFHVDGDQGCVMWIAVDGANRQTGTLGYVRGSHRWPATFKANLFTTQLAFPGTEGEQLPDIDNNEDMFDIAYFDVEPGDVIIHHFRTVHGSHGNASTSRTRRAASLRYVGEQVRFRTRPGIPAQPHRPLDWEDGVELCDPWFPLVWHRPRPAIAA